VVFFIEVEPAQGTASDHVERLRITDPSEFAIIAGFLSSERSGFPL